jgi:hypothetical protein
MKNDKAFTIRSYRDSDRAAVRRLCCQTGFLGDPIDPVYEDRELFADFLTTYYTDHEPESCLHLEVDRENPGYHNGTPNRQPAIHVRLVGSVLCIRDRQIDVKMRNPARPRGHFPPPVDEGPSNKAA